MSGAPPPVQHHTVFSLDEFVATEESSHLDTKPDIRISLIVDNHLGMAKKRIELKSPPPPSINPQSASPAKGSGVSSAGGDMTPHTAAPPGGGGGVVTSAEIKQSLCKELRSLLTLYDPIKVAGCGGLSEILRGSGGGISLRWLHKHAHHCPLEPSSCTCAEKHAKKNVMTLQRLTYAEDSSSTIYINSPRSVMCLLRQGLRPDEILQRSVQQHANDSLASGDVTSPRALRRRIGIREEERKQVYKDLVQEYMEICNAISLEEIVEGTKQMRRGRSPSPPSFGSTTTHSGNTTGKLQPLRDSIDTKKQIKQARPRSPVEGAPISQKLVDVRDMLKKRIANMIDNQTRSIVNRWEDDKKQLTQEMEEKNRLDRIKLQPLVNHHNTTTTHSHYTMNSTIKTPSKSSVVAPPLGNSTTITSEGQHNTTTTTNNNPVGDPNVESSNNNQQSHLENNTSLPATAVVRGGVRSPSPNLKKQRGGGGGKDVKDKLRIVQDRRQKAEQAKFHQMECTMKEKDHKLQEAQRQRTIEREKHQEESRQRLRLRKTVVERASLISDYQKLHYVIRQNERDESHKQHIEAEQKMADEVRREIQKLEIERRKVEEQLGKWKMNVEKELSFEHVNAIAMHDGTGVLDQSAMAQRHRKSLTGNDTITTNSSHGNISPTVARSNSHIRHQPRRERNQIDRILDASLKLRENFL
eukprot:PhF_6_TR12660/c0_g1_i5/m.20136